MGFLIAVVSVLVVAVCFVYCGLYIAYKKYKASIDAKIAENYLQNEQRSHKMYSTTEQKKTCNLNVPSPHLSIHVATHSSMTSDGNSTESACISTRDEQELPQLEGDVVTDNGHVKIMYDGVE